MSGNDKKAIDPFDIPTIDLKSDKAKRAMGIEDFHSKPEKKIIPVKLEGEEVELFEKSFKASTSKTQQDLAKNIILNAIKNGD